jgi:hypothetical protein
MTSIHQRGSKITRDLLGLPSQPLPGFLDHLPHLLAAQSFRELVHAIVGAHRRKKPVILAAGAHALVKCGLTPMWVDLIQRGLITAIATNGASLVHDVELSMFGHTSEDVEATLAQGQFGMTEETGAFINNAINACVHLGQGMGEALGYTLWLTGRAPTSLLGAAWEHEVPVTIHVGMGTDVWQLHPKADGAKIGEGSLRDFRTLTSELAQLGDGGVLLHAGSAVILPEVILKAFSHLLADGMSLSGAVMANVDMIRHYRPMQQIVSRPRTFGATTLELIGQFELLLPLLFSCVLAELEKSDVG